MHSCVYGSVSRAELYEAINGEPSLRDIYLTQIHIGAGRLLYTRWREKGYDDNEYKWVSIQTYFHSIAQMFHVSRILALNTSWSTWCVMIPPLSSKALWKISSFTKSVGPVWVIQRWWIRNLLGFVGAWGISPRSYLILAQHLRPTIHLSKPFLTTFSTCWSDDQLCDQLLGILFCISNFGTFEKSVFEQKLKIISYHIHPAHVPHSVSFDYLLHV